MPTCRSTYVVVCAGALAFAVGCSKSHEPEETVPQESATTQGGEAQDATSRLDESSSDAMAAKAAQDQPLQDDMMSPMSSAATVEGVTTVNELSEAEIAGFMEVVNTRKIEQALIAQKRAIAPQIRQYAARVIADHREAQQANAEFVQREQIVPDVDAPIASEVSEQEAGVLQSLEDTLRSKKLDRIYIETQLRQHRRTIGLLDAKLIPSAKDERLEIQLLRMRAMLERHLTQARNIDLTL